MNFIKLNKMTKVKINNRVYDVTVADTEATREKGLQNVKSLPENEGMLFVFEEEDEVSFWMKDTSINLDLIFINEDEEIVKVSTGYADTEDPHTANSCMYVLEVNQGSGIKKGDDIEILGLWESDESDEEEEDEEEDETIVRKMLVLNEDGTIQMTLNGGERIFSRKHTKLLVKYAKRAFKSKADKDYKALGKRIFKFIDYQDNKEDDFVTIKE